MWATTKSMITKSAGKSLAVLMAMTMQQYDIM
jgi:hypothetical protein